MQLSKKDARLFTYTTIHHEMRTQDREAVQVDIIIDDIRQPSNVKASGLGARPSVHERVSSTPSP